MNGKERTIAVLEGKQPDAVPHFELEMQLTEEYFGKRFSTKTDWESEPDKRTTFLRNDAELFVQIADYFDYGIIFVSQGCRPTFDDFRECLRYIREIDDGRHLVMAHGGATPGIPNGRNMDTVITEMMMYPERTKESIRERVDNRLEWARLLTDEKLLDGSILCTDYCFNSGPYLSPMMFSDIITPEKTRLVQGYRDLGLYTIVHTDGNIMPILDDLVSTGTHGLHSLDPMAGVDIKKVKELIGDRVCLIGNVNCAYMQNGTDEQVLESCRYAMEHGKPEGRYIFSTSNCIFKGIPRERYDLLLAFYKDNRLY